MDPEIDFRPFYETSYARDFAHSAEKYSKACDILKNCRRVLDMGCGDGSFLTLLRTAYSVPELFGVEISKEASSLASQKGIDARCLDVGRDRLPFPDGFFDGIFCGEIIEHLYDPDHLLDEAQRVLKAGGLFVITTPNLGSWYNRLSLLLGYQPFFTEVSLRHGVGHLKPFWLSAGHLRIFTLRALSELVRLHKFKIVNAIGFGINTRVGYGRQWKKIAKICNRIFSMPSLSSDIMLVLTKN